MARCPLLTWRPVTIKDGYRPTIKPVRVNLHVAVSEAATLHGYFNQSIKNPDSHAYIRKDGSGEQYVDSARQAYADLEGNRDTLSVETQGGVRNVNGEEWTAAQCEALAQFIAWAHKVHGIPLKVATDSRPGPSSHGVSWHRLGIDGNFPGGLLKGRVPGGLKYSNARGKVCPGDAKIRQIPGIVARAQELAGFGVAGITIPPLIPEGHLDMGSMSADDLNKHLSRHAENIVAQVTKNMPNVIRQQVAVQNTALHNMVRRELAMALSANGVDIDGLAERVAGLLEDDLIDAVTQTISQMPGATPEQIKAEVRQDIANRLTQEA